MTSPTCWLANRSTRRNKGLPALQVLMCGLPPGVDAFLARCANNRLKPVPACYRPLARAWSTDFQKKKPMIPNVQSGDTQCGM